MVGQLVANPPDQSQHVEIETTSWQLFCWVANLLDQWSLGNNPT